MVASVLLLPDDWRLVSFPGGVFCAAPTMGPQRAPHTHLTARSRSPSSSNSYTDTAGILDSGKTTLVNHILQSTGLRIAIIENEFGEVGVDDGLVSVKPFACLS